MRKVFIDADTGIDDAVAIMLMATHPRIEIVGAGSCWGSLDSEQTAFNTRTVLNAVGLPTVPVSVGARAPIRRTFEPFHGIMGTDGLGDSQDRSTERPVYTSRSAAEALVAAADEAGGDLEVLATGPLTNVAIALTTAPQLASQIRRLVVMGGAFGAAGNVTAVAEANFWGDPEAADIVATSGVPLTIVGLDVTSQVLLSDTDLQRWGSDGSLGAFASSISGPYFDFYAGRLGVRAAPFHDATAAAVLVEPTIAEYEHPQLRVCCHDDDLRGFCVVDRRSWAEQVPSVSIATTVDANAVRTSVERALRRPSHAG